ncbi:MAG: hypothetical protein PHH91_08875 [Desulfuromonadaceae bacterium]|nr:hypothetical protein [Desulfuromonadaceae bacterium]
MGIFGNLFGNSNNNSRPPSMKEKIKLSIEELFDCAKADNDNLIALIESAHNSKATVRQKSESLSEFISLHIGHFYMFLLSPNNKDIIGTLTIDELYNRYTRELLDIIYTNKGNAIAKDNIVHYATNHYKHEKVTMYLGCGDYFKGRIYTIFNVDKNDFFLTSAIHQTTYNSITSALAYNKIIFDTKNAHI